MTCDLHHLGALLELLKGFEIGFRVLLIENGIRRLELATA